MLVCSLCNVTPPCRTSKGPSWPHRWPWFPMTTTCGVQNLIHKERYDQVSCRHICNKRGQYRPSSTWLCFVMLRYLYCCIVLNKCLIQAIVLLSFPVEDNEDDYSCKRMLNQLVPLLYSSRFFCIYAYRDAQLDFSGTAQNVQMVHVLHNTSSCTIHRMVL